MRASMEEDDCVPMKEDIAIETWLEVKSILCFWIVFVDSSVMLPETTHETFQRICDHSLWSDITMDYSLEL